MYSKLSVPISESLKQECQNHKERFAVYDKDRKRWLVEPNERHEYCYYGNDFQKFDDAKKDEVYQERFLLVGKYTILQQEPKLLESTEAAPEFLDTFELPTLKLIVGVPGCGKTTHIINNHHPGSLVLTSCAEGAADIRARIEAAHGGYGFDSTDYYKYYRTIDSYLLHHNRVVHYNQRRRSRYYNTPQPHSSTYNTVWVDEALMEHPGKIFLVCLFSRCTTMYLLGDPNQLGYINRVDGVKLLYDKPSAYFTPTDIMNVSYRCPVDVMAILSSKYDGGAYSATEVMLSMQCKKFTELKWVPKSDKIKYLVFKQAEKQLMEKGGYNVSTIHEFQGKEADDVIVVRMSRKVDEPLYKSLPHILVGMSRHRKSLVYYTPVEDDMKKLIETPLTLTDLKKIKKS